MVAFYIDRIKNMKMTLKDVPPRWLAEVEKKLSEDAQT